MINWLKGKFVKWPTKEQIKYLENLITYSNLNLANYDLDNFTYDDVEQLINKIESGKEGI